MTKEEIQKIKEASKDKDKYIAQQSLAIKRSCDEKFGKTLVCIGTPEQIAKAKKDWQEAKDAYAAEHICEIHQEADALFFGTQGEEEALKSVKAAEAKTSSIILSWEPGELDQFFHN